MTKELAPAIAKSTLMPSISPVVKTPTVAKMETFVLSAASPAPVSKSIFDNSNQVTDGKLKMFIEAMDETCYKPGDSIPIKITYQNLTNQQLVIVDYNVISSSALMGTYGQLVPILTAKDGKRIYSPEYFSDADGINVNPTLVQKLPSTSSFNFSIEYPLQIENVESDKDGKMLYRPLLPGRYFLKFVYVAIEFEHAWEGKISSNQIEICVAN